MTPEKILDLYEQGLITKEEAYLELYPFRKKHDKDAEEIFKKIHDNRVTRRSGRLTPNLFRNSRH